MKGKEASYNYNNVLLECVFKQNQCSINDFIETNVDYFEDCLTFNRGQDNKGIKLHIVQLAREGWWNGLNLKMHAGSLLPGAIYVLIHNQLEYMPVLSASVLV